MKDRIPAQPVVGRIIPHTDQQSCTFVWQRSSPSLSTPSRPQSTTYYFRYALTIMGPEHHYLPAVVLDDWGNEIKGARMYSWIAKKGDAFPRAEIFGYLRSRSGIWEEKQQFVRDLELTFSYAVYLATNSNLAPEKDLKVNRIALPSDKLANASPQPIAIPADIKMPLKNSDPSWWKVPTDWDVEMV